MLELSMKYYVYESNVSSLFTFLTRVTSEYQSNYSRTVRRLTSYYPVRAAVLPLAIEFTD